MKFPGRLPRLPREYYQGDAFVHWTLTIHNRATGWLTDTFHARFRELMIHAAAREGLFCPTYCLMPDHLHLLWLGLRRDSDQLNGMAFLRTYLEPALVGDEVASRPDKRDLNHKEHSLRCALPRIRFQPQAHDSVLREQEREHGALAKACFYLLDNPVQAKLVSLPAEWRFSGAIVPGYPTLQPLNADFWEKFWKLYTAARQPDAGNLKRPSF